MPATDPSTLGDTLPPGDSRGPSYDISRGTCPECGSSDVIHLVIGMPIDPSDFGSGPDWVEWVGCMHPGYTRRCGTCASTWTPEQVPDRFENLADLMVAAGADNLEDLGDWIAEDYDLDVEARMDEGTFFIRMGTRGVGIAFPVTVDEFWVSVDDLHEEMSAEADVDEPGERAEP